MREEAELWLGDADYDLGCARDLMEKDRFNYVVWFARQAAEKALKAAFLAVLKEPVPRSHNLLQLAQQCFGDEAQSIRVDLSFLNPHYVSTRYVDSSVGAPSQVYSRDIAQEALKRAAEVIEWVRMRMRA